jgi:hypothetical protein
VILDPEKPWYNQYGHAKTLVSASRSAIGPRPVGVSSYGWPAYHPKFPWEQFADAADFGVPQVYKGLELGNDYQRIGVEAYQDLGFGGVVPALAAYYWGREDMLTIYNRTPQPNGAVIWWDFYNLDQESSRWRAVWQAGRVVKPKGPGGLAAPRKSRLAHKVKRRLFSRHR